MTRKKDKFEDLDRDKPLHPNQTLVVSVPIPPSVNHIYQSAGRGRRLTSAAKDYIKIAQDICKKAKRGQGWKKDKDHVWWIMDMYFYVPDKRVRDTHNCIKLLADALEGLIFPNDYFLLPRIQYVCLDRKNPRLELIIYAQKERDD